jgi:prophage DNA circulation protein
MSVLINGTELRTINFGVKVTGGAKTLPASVTGTIFTVSGGRVLVTGIVGVVTTAIQAQANAIKLVATPTVGTVNDLSATVESNGAALGTLFSPLGLAGDALVKSTGGGVSLLRNPIVVAAGAIGLNAAATNTGAITWTITYVPLDDGASVVAA